MTDCMAERQSSPAGCMTDCMATRAVRPGMAANCLSDHYSEGRRQTRVLSLRAAMCHRLMQDILKRQTAVTAYSTSKQLLLFAFALCTLPYRHVPSDFARPVV